MDLILPGCVRAHQNRARPPQIWCAWVGELADRRALVCAVLMRGPDVLTASTCNTPRLRCGNETHSNAYDHTP